MRYSSLHHQGVQPRIQPVWTPQQGFGALGAQRVVGPVNGNLHLGPFLQQQHQQQQQQQQHFHLQSHHPHGISTGHPPPPPPPPVGAPTTTGQKRQFSATTTTEGKKRNTVSRSRPGSVAAPDSSTTTSATAAAANAAQWRNNGVVYHELTLRQFIESGRLEEDVEREKSEGLKGDAATAAGSTGMPATAAGQGRFVSEVNDVSSVPSMSTTTTSITAALTPVDPQTAARHFRKYQIRCAAGRASALFDAHARREWMRRLYHPVEAEKTKATEDERRRRACQRFVCSITERGLPTLDRLPDAELVAARLFGGGVGHPGAPNLADSTIASSKRTSASPEPAATSGAEESNKPAAVALEDANKKLDSKDTAPAPAAGEPSESDSAKETDNDETTTSSPSSTKTRFQVGDVEVDFGASSEEDDDDDQPGAGESDDDDFGIETYDRHNESSDKSSSEPPGGRGQVEQPKENNNPGDARRCGRVQTVRHLPAFLRCQLHERIPRQAFVDTVLNAVGSVSCDVLALYCWMLL